MASICGDILKSASTKRSVNFVYSKVFVRPFCNYFHDHEVDNKHSHIAELSPMELKNLELISRRDAFRLKFDHEIKTGRAADIVCIDPGSKTNGVAHFDQSVDGDTPVGLESFCLQNMKTRLMLIQLMRKPIAYALGVSLMPPDHEKKEFMHLSQSIDFVKRMDKFFKVKFCYANEYGTSQEATKRMAMMTKKEKEKLRKKGEKDGLKDIVSAIIILENLLDFVIEEFGAQGEMQYVDHWKSKGKTWFNYGKLEDDDIADNKKMEGEEAHKD